jgi:methyl-accepting chemotaxis protein
LFSLLKLTVGLKVRLLGMLILLLGGVGLACASWQNEQNLVDQRVTQTRFLVETAATIVEHHRESVHQGKVTAAAAKAAAIAELRELRYGEDDYFWINDMAPVMVMHPMKPELEGKNIGNMKHPKGHKLFASMVAVVRDHGAGVVRYEWSKPGESKPVPKISYVKGVPEWNWVVGSAACSTSSRPRCGRSIMPCPTRRRPRGSSRLPRSRSPAVRTSRRRAWRGRRRRSSR